MFMQLVAAFFVIGCLGMLFYTPAKFNRGIKLTEYGALTTGDRVMSVIPFYNLINAEKVYTGSGKSILITLLALVLSIIFRVMVVFTFIDVFALNLVTVVLCAATAIASLAANIHLVYMVLNDADCMGIGQKLIYSILFPLGQNYIGNYLPAVMAAMLKEEETF